MRRNLPSKKLTCVKAAVAPKPYIGRMNEKPLMESGTAKILSLPEETQFAANGIVSRTLLRTENSRTTLFGFAEGQELTEHTSTQHALIQILSGGCQFFINGTPHRLKAGDILHLPPNLPHAVQAVQSFSMLLTLTKPSAAEKFNPATETGTTRLENPIDPAKIFDGRNVPCTVKHGRIIQRWLDLAVGDYFVLRNDHDPERMRQKFETEWPGTFSWEHLQRGPEDFQVKITKREAVTRVAEPAGGCES